MNCVVYTNCIFVEWTTHHLPICVMFPKVRVFLGYESIKWILLMDIKISKIKQLLAIVTTFQVHLPSPWIKTRFSYSNLTILRLNFASGQLSIFVLQIKSSISSHCVKYFQKWVSQKNKKERSRPILKESANVY